MGISFVCRESDRLHERVNQQLPQGRDNAVAEQKTKHRICADGATAKQATHGARSSSHTSRCSTSQNSLAPALSCRHAYTNLLPQPACPSPDFESHRNVAPLNACMNPGLQTGPPACISQPPPGPVYFSYNVPRTGTKKKECVSCVSRSGHRGRLN